MNRIAIVLCILTALIMCNSASAVVIDVPADQPTIQAGIVAAGNGDVVMVAPGTYTENIDLLGKNIRVIGDGGPIGVTLQPGNGAIRTVNMASALPASAEFSGFTVVGGNGDAALFIGGGAPVVQNCVFRGYSSGVSNAVVLHVAGGDPLITRNIFHDNLGISCVGIFNGTARLYNNTFHNNARGFFSISGLGIARNNIISRSWEYGVAGNFPVLAYNNFFGNSPNYLGPTPGATDISVDPLFIDTAADDYHLSTLSPCIDAGDPSPSFNDVDGTRNDIGALSVLLDPPAASALNLGDEDRLHVIDHFPAFYWTVLTEVGTPSGYEVEVGSDLDWAVAELWSTGPVLSADTFAVYAGAALIDGESYYVRVRVNDGVEWGGWNTILFRMNTPPTTPIPISPISGAMIPAIELNLVADNATDAEGDARTYEFEVYSDAGLTMLEESLIGVLEQNDQTSSGLIEGLANGPLYWWRVRAADGYESSEWSSIEPFETSPPITRRVPSEYPTIQAAIDAAGSGDSVLVAPGTYVENINFLGQSLYLISEHGPEVTTISAADPLLDVIIIINSLACFIEGFTIRDVDYYASVGIDCSDCNLTIRDNIFTNNTEAAVWIRDGGSVIAEENEFFDNVSAGDAATLLCRGFDQAIVRNNVFRDNQSNWNGGGLHFSNGNYAEAQRNVIIRNGYDTDVGGGVFVLNVDQVVLVNNTIDQNASSGAGGGLFIADVSSLLVQNNIVSNNAGTGIHTGGYIGSVNSDYNNVWGNGAANYTGLYQTPATHDISADPMFNAIDPTQFERGLWFTSPCRDAGNPAPAYNDPDGTRNDIGAYPFSLSLPLAGDLNLGPTEAQFRVISHTPRIYWSYLDTSGSQQGFEVEFGSDADWSSAELWQTGQLASADTSVLYAGLTLLDGVVYYYRVRVSDGTNWGAWLTESFRMNSPPPIPIPATPLDEDTLHYQIVRSVVANSVDPEGDTIEYEFELYYDEDPSALLDVQYLNSGIGQTQSEIWNSLSPDTWYWWRARGIDGYEYSPWTEFRAFYARRPAIIRVPGKAATILAAIELTGNYDTIQVGPGTYSGNLNLQGRALTLLSDSGATSTVISSNAMSDPHIWLGSPPAIEIEIAGFTFVGGVAASMITVNGGAPRIHDNIFRDFNGQPNPSMVLHVIAGSPTISHNIFMNNKGVSCVGIYGGSAQVINNTFDRNRGGLHLIGGSAEIQNNIVTGSTTFGLYGNLTNADYNCLFGNFPNHDQYAGGPNDVIASPMYYDPVGGDFRLQPGSPCINAGNPGAEYNDSDGSRNDIGAFAAVCDCSCQSDPVCDHQTDILDVAFVIAGAFRGLSEIMDDFCFPHGNTVGGRTDVNCSGSTDIVDVVRAIDVAFRGVSPASAFCTLCIVP